MRAVCEWCDAVYGETAPLEGWRDTPGHYGACFTEKPERDGRWATPTSTNRAADS